ncbi:tRNA adenylyltransferase [Sporobolomyces salmoneus]|uniref:tRNA adenylyltransferase n=1 Tax=Sporobolomyces salmoneus TaxID=183962 RepID=UPI00317AB9E0
MLRRSLRISTFIRSTSSSSLPLRSPSYSIRSMSIPTIALTPNEQRLAGLLVECAEWVDRNPQKVDDIRLKDENGEWIGKLRGRGEDEKVELRIAGGWVRDKLLGKESDDIDISTSPDPITGLKFATLFEQYLETLDQRHLMGKLTKIEAKPEQSKHLETATARVCDLSVDWVQQRGQEVYSPGSRIPTVAFGSPLEDAERRDLTINALFYNLRTRQIEDQTGKGLSDLGFRLPSHPKRIRTPLEPFQTFKDDPLRVVRAVRFAARFGREFELDEELVRAIEREEIRQALLDPKKISRERVGAELDKMLLGKDPEYAFELIERLHLHPLVFLYDHSTTFQSSCTDPSESETPPPLPETSISVTASNILTSLVRNRNDNTQFPPLHSLLKLHTISPPPLPPHSTLPPYPAPIPLPSSPSSPTTPPLATIYPHTLKRLYLSCGLLPLYDLSTIEKKKTIWIGEKVIRDGIKGPTIDAAFCKKLREGWEVLHAEVERLAKEKEGERNDEPDRVRLGMLLRNPSIHDGQHMRWNVGLFWSLVVDLVKAQNDSNRQIELINAYNRFVGRILTLKLDSGAFAPPLLDGKTINTLLPFTKSSPAMVSILNLVIERQLALPESTKESMTEWLMTEEMRGIVEGLCEKVRRDRGGNSTAGVKRKGGGG